MNSSKNANRIQIVAFSDPNDLLSYQLRQCDLQERSEDGSGVILQNIVADQHLERVLPSNIEVDGFNVTYTVCPWAILGIFSDPIEAHDNWWTDAAVPGLLVLGHATTK